MNNSPKLLRIVSPPSEPASTLNLKVLLGDEPIGGVVAIELPRIDARESGLAVALLTCHVELDVYIATTQDPVRRVLRETLLALAKELCPSGCGHDIAPRPLRIMPVGTLGIVEFHHAFGVCPAQAIWRRLERC